MGLEIVTRVAPRGWGTLVAPYAVVWLALMVATAISLETGAGHYEGGVGVALVVLGAAFIKVLLIGEYFMDLRHAPLLLRGAFVAYCFVVGTVMIVLAS